MSNEVQDLIEHEYGMYGVKILEFDDFQKFKFTRSHFTIEHEDKKYFLKISEKTEKDLIVNEAKISQQFNRHYFLNCPRIIENKSWLPYAEYNEKIVVLYEFISAQNLVRSGEPIDKKIFASIAMLHANLNENVDKIPDVKSKHLMIASVLKKIELLLAEINKRIESQDTASYLQFHKEYLVFVQEELHLLSDTIQKIESLPKQLIHGDLDPQNISIHNGKVMFFDWERAMIYFRVYDIMRAVHFSYSPPRSESQALDVEKIIESVATYNKIERLTALELKYCMDVYYIDWLTDIQLLWNIYHYNIDFEESMIEENFGILRWIKQHKDLVSVRLQEIGKGRK